MAGEPEKHDMQALMLVNTDFSVAIGAGSTGQPSAMNGQVRTFLRVEHTHGTSVYGMSPDQADHLAEGLKKAAQDTRDAQARHDLAPDAGKILLPPGAHGANGQGPTPPSSEQPG